METSPSRGTALVTGASSGIGRSFSHILAHEGYDLILVARNPATLEQTAESVRRQNPGRSARVHSIDLATPDGPDRLYQAVRDDGLAVNVLINNAGFGSLGPFAESSLEGDLDMIQVNVSALTALTRLFLADMLGRHAGRILNVASTAAFLPGPYMAVYYATKAYVLSFSEAIAHELEGSGVSVTCLCPGPTPTNFGARAGSDQARMFRTPLILHPDEVAWAGYRGLLRGDPVVIPGAANRLTALGSRLAPRRLLLNVVRRVHQPG